MMICVYASASERIGEIYKKEAYELGKRIAEEGYDTLFGGGSTGLMGALANGAYDNDGKVYGVAPVWLNNFEEVYSKCEGFLLTKKMDERKSIFLLKADIFLVIPGGFGTLDEFFEVLTLKQLNQHNKPIIVYNFNNFYDKLLEFLEKIYNEKFIHHVNDNIYDVANTFDEIFEIINKK